MIYAETTSVSVEKTRAELETVLRSYGADAFGYMADPTRAAITFKANGKFVRFMLPLPSPSDKRFTEYKRGGYSYCRTKEAARKEWEQACRSSWRALFLAVKAKLVAVQTGIATFEDEFLAYVVLPNQQTVGEMAMPMIEQAYSTGQMPEFTLALPPRRDS